MYVEYYSNRTGKLLGTIMEHKGRLFTDSTDPFLLDELQDFSKPGFPLKDYFSRVSRRFEMGTSYKVFNDEDQQIVIREDGQIIVVKPDTATETTADLPQETADETAGLPDVSSVDDVVYARIGFYNLGNERLGAIEFRNGDLVGLDDYGTKHLAGRLEATKPENVVLHKKYILMVNLEERASYVSNIVEELVREGDITDA